MRWVVLIVLAAPRPVVAGDVDFNRDVQPILTAHCYACHGPDANARKADLRLDVPGDAVNAKAIARELIARVTAADGDGRMPPPKIGSRLSADQVRVLKAWVEQGAKYAEHWAFVPPTRPAVPRGANAIDHFILARLKKEGLAPAPRASREVLIRRAAIDLTGLPPTPEEIDAFVKDNSADAWATLIDRLLASPHYGERWGRHWLDVARYADSGGFETDIFYGGAWRYRDYVIKAFNADKPFDRFVKEQIAGDELWATDRTAKVATGLYAVGPVLQEAGMVPGKLDYDWLTDAADTTGSAFLGLTVGCARCHDHKFDPVSQKDYFGLQAVFAGSDLFDFKTDGSVLKDHVALRKTETEFEQARKRTDAKARDGDFDEYPEIPLRGLSHRTKAKAAEVRLLKRGELNAPGDAVPAGLPAKLAGGSLAGVPREKWRSALADWVASKDNPLTARVFVNRVWQGHFGYGLVRTPNDFGTRGDRPTHPELLDWLAVEFVTNSWSVKHLHRRIMLSNAYQMSAAPDAVRADPENRLLARFQPRRVEAEVVWDAMRAAAGTLDRRMYGLPVFPPLDERELIGNYKKWTPSPEADANRRAVYLVARRSFRLPALGAFDPPDNATSCGQRDCTIVPNQALALLNNKGVRQQAAAFADRLLRETDGTPAAVAGRAWVLAYGRPISDDERRAAVAFLADCDKAAVTELCVALFNTNEFLYLP